ncbi:LysR substrate-binding domain-containing protein [Saccharopolyspora oryzae]|uniref:LysR substrate-binding domain-containing protein n=1 Tax=Saccharopolyspora oryzae TaxID=2997343 RepID=A0ABT4V8N8_9PSEU|nr:LysR substrate-binding domain-containing protein [Saccharopolyspora oryzae]MDA3629754.1 LysR substrate-binding domain-containing protein [Saccharopolyspora oryzae]
MELRHLRYFTVLAEELHFGRAAARLHMAQPPLSQRIRDLERELGVELFDRGRRQVTLTEAGALLLEHSRRVLESAESAQEAMRRLRPGENGVVHVGIPPDTMPVTLRTLLHEFAERAPDVLVDLHELTTDEQLAALREGSLDAAMVRHPCDISGLDSSPVARRALGVLLPVEHPLADSEQVRLRDLNGQPLVIFPRAMAPMLYDHVLSICRAEGFRPGAIRHARNPNFVHGLVLAGRGVHFNEPPPGEPRKGLVWRPLEDSPLSWRTSVVWVPRRRHAAIDAFAAVATTGLAAAGHHPEEPPQRDEKPSY